MEFATKVYQCLPTHPLIKFRTFHTAGRWPSTQSKFDLVLTRYCPVVTFTGHNNVHASKMFKCSNFHLKDI